MKRTEKGYADATEPPTRSHYSRDKKTQPCRRVLSASPFFSLRSSEPPIGDRLHQ